MASGIRGLQFPEFKYHRLDQLFRYLGTALMNCNSIFEGSKSRFKLGNAVYHSVQNLLSSSLLSKVYKTKILPIILYGYETL
jgi:hypothetical protein